MSKVKGCSKGPTKSMTGKHRATVGAKPTSLGLQAAAELIDKKLKATRKLPRGRI